MNLRLPLYIGGAILAASIASCNSSSDPYTVVTDDSGEYAAYVNSFSLASDTSVLANLDTVFFSIDLDNARIFNADSLPKGTDVSKLVVKIGLPAVSEAKLIVPAEESTSKPDTINYLENSTDTVCFSRGPVTLHVVSYNREVSRDYEIKVNVHNEIADTLFWNRTAQATLPTTLATASTQGTAEIDGTVICLTGDGNAFSCATTDDPFTGQWTTEAATLPTGARPSTLTAAGGKLYLVTDDNSLYSSDDKGATWTATGAAMCRLLGANGSTLLGLRCDTDGKYYHVTYPASTVVEADASFPVSGFSQPVEYVTEWSASPMTVILGGTTAQGTPTGAAWAFDGETWAAISNTPLPDLTGLTLFPYFSFRIDDAWVATRSTVLMAFGGMAADGTMNRTTYLSYDQGVNWTKAGDMLNLPPEIPPFYGAQAIIRKQTMYPRSQPSSAWTMMPQRALPAWYAIELPAASSRATRPIEEWECPYIYLFGGYDADGALQQSIWRGVINRLTFKPIQ